MSIKPVLVPDHTANDLRRLMDSFAEASTGPTKRQLTESRAAVAAAQGVAEGAFDIFKKLPPSGSTVKIDGRPVKISYGSHGGEDNSHVNFSWNDTNGKEHYVEARVETIPNLRALAKRIKGEMDWVEQQNAAQGVAEGKKRSDRYHIVGKDGNPASLASYADQASAVKDRDEKHPGAEVRQVGPRGKIKGVSEGIMDTVKQTFNDCVVGYPMGTSDEQFIQGWARAIQAETGRDIPLEKLTQLYQDYVERSDEIMQSHGTTNEEQGVTEGEGMSRAAKGYEKYGREGMAALAKAGREGRALDPVRQKYDRYDEAVAEGAGAMPVNKYIAQELDNLLKLAQDQVDDITNRSRGGYGNKKSGGLEDAIFELSGVSNGFHSSMAEGVAELQELNSGLPRIGNWIMRNLKKVGNRIDLPQLIKQETSNNQGVTETHDNDARAVLRNRIVADVLNFYSLNDRIPSIKEFSRPVRAKLNALEFDERSTVFRQAVVQALKLLGKQGMSAALTLDEAGRPDVMRHAGDTTVKVVKRAGKPIGEIGIDAEASEGNGQYYVKLYDGSYDAVGFDTAEEALAELKYAISEGLAEVLGTSPDRLMARTGMNLPHKFPRAGQTNLGNIPGTNLPDSSEQTKKYGQERRANRPDNLKAAIRDQLGKHNRPDLPESGVTEARNNVSVPAALEMLKDARAYLDQFDPEDDDDYFDAYETIAAEFDMESNDSSNDPLTDLLDMYEVNPQQAAQMLADHLQSQSKDVTEGWKSKLAGAALAGAAAFGGGGAQANDQIAKDTQGIGQAFRSGQMAPKQYAPGEISLSQIYSHPKWLETVQAMIKKYPKNHEDDQRAMNAAREAIKQMIQQGNVREGSAQQVDEKSEAIRHGNNSRSIYHVDESVDPVEQLRADIKRFSR